MLEVIGTSALAVILAEIGDKTQLLALLLAVKFQKPWPIVAGIFAATIFNHAIAGAAGGWIASVLTPQVLSYVLACGFFAMGIWILVPDKQEGGLLNKGWIVKMGVFGTTVVTFFLAEMGDKTQLATVALAAHFDAPIEVVIGTTVGMLAADVPAVFLGSAATTKIPMKPLRIVCAILFIGLAVSSLFVNLTPSI